MIISASTDYRAAAQRKLPPFLFHYIDGGAYAEYTLRRNVEDLSAIALRQRVLKNMSGFEPGDPPVRRDPGDAGGARPGRPHRHVRPPRRGPGGARGGGEGRALHPVDGVGLPDRGSRPGHRPADVVPALRAQGPRLHAQRPGAGQGRRRHHPGVHRRHAGPRRPLPRRPFGHERPLRRSAPHPPGHDPPRLGLGCRPAGQAPRPRQHLHLPRQPDRPGGLHRLAGRQLRPVDFLERPGVDP